MSRLSAVAAYSAMALVLALVAGCDDSDSGSEDPVMEMRRAIVGVLTEVTSVSNVDRGCIADSLIADGLTPSEYEAIGTDRGMTNEEFFTLVQAAAPECAP